MKLTELKIKVEDLVKDYLDSEEEGCFALGGKLVIRPEYQREFVYNDKQRDLVIQTVSKNLPLNVMYWAKQEDEDRYEVLDGQQRTISICQFVSGVFSTKYFGGTTKYFHNLSPLERKQVLDYELTVYLCEGSVEEKLEWFKIINIAGEPLNDQELRNSTYTGRWLSACKKYFSKRKGPAFNRGEKYMKGSPERQDYLETVLGWISNNNIDDYMSAHQKDPTATEIISYYENVMQWVKDLFPTYRKEMKGIKWGELYNEYGKGHVWDPYSLEERVKQLMEDEDVTKKSGIYYYVFSGEEKHLSIRAFDNKIKREAYERIGGICPCCGKHFELEEMQADHITPWSKGGKTIVENCQLLCAKCNREKSNK